MGSLTLGAEFESLLVELHEKPSTRELAAGHRLREILVAMESRVLTTLEELDSAEAFESLCLMPEGGPLLVDISRTDGDNFWQDPGWEGEYTSAERQPTSPRSASSRASR